MFHFILPFALLGLTVAHLLFLHQTGSNNPLGINRNYFKVPFHPYYTFKDILGFVVALAGLVLLSLVRPYYLGDPENFIPADPIKTPIHIKPE